MSEPTNLRQYRKQAARDAKRVKGAENAAKFGQSKASKVLSATRDLKSRKMLDQHRLNDQDEA